MECNIPHEMQESVADVIGRKIKIVWQQIVRYEVKPEKFENKILALTDYRLFALATKVPTKLEQSIHFLDIQSVESKKPNQIVIATEGKRLVYYPPDTLPDGADTVISHIGTSLHGTFPNLPYEKIIPKMTLLPEERMAQFKEKIHQRSMCSVGPCGGFSTTYACMCDYHHLPFMEDVAWDVDTIYLSQDSRELCLRDFDHLESKNLVPIISALEHNCWFTKLNVANIKLGADACNEILRVMRSNTTLEELYLSNIGIKWDFAHRLAQSLLANTKSPLTTLDLSHNYIEDRGVTHLCSPVSKLSRGLVHLNLAKTAITAKGVNKLAEALSNNTYMAASLKHLDLSDNYLKGEDITNLYNFLAQPNTVSTLRLAGTECALEHIFGALLRGCCKHMTHLDLSSNVYSSKRSKDSNIPLAWKHFFASVESLQAINLSNNKLPPEAAKNVLLGISSNKNIKDIHVNLSCNEFRTWGAQVLETCFCDLHHVTSLDISDNSFDMELENLCQSLAKTRGLKRLAIGKNFNSIKQKHLTQVLDAVVLLIQEDESTIEALSLADSKLKLDTCNIINALGSNSTLKEIDLSGNSMGDLGARMLAKALQLNNHLHTLYWDKNGTSAAGFEDIADALSKNFCVKKMPVPIQDASLALKTNPDKVEKALQRIETLLQRNHSPRKFSSAKAYRLQQGLLLSASQQMVDHLTLQIQQHVSTLQSGHVPSAAKKDIDRANHLIKDADKSKQLLLRLQEVASQAEKEDNEIEASLRNISANLHDVIEKQLKSNVEDMLKCVEGQCPAMMDDREFRDGLKNTCTEKSSIPSTFSHNLINGHVSTDVMNKVSELNLAVASHMSDRLVDGVLDSLQEVSKTLNNYVKNRGNETEDVTSPVKSPEAQFEDKLLLKLKDRLIPEESPYSTLKKKKLDNRRLRPQSVIDATDVKKALALAKGEDSSANQSATSDQHANEGDPVANGSTVTPSVSMATLNEGEVEGDKAEESIDKGKGDSGTEPPSGSPTTPSEEQPASRSSFYLPVIPAHSNQPPEPPPRENKWFNLKAWRGHYDFNQWPEDTHNPVNTTTFVSIPNIEWFNDYSETCLERPHVRAVALDRWSLFKAGLTVTVEEEDDDTVDGRDPSPFPESPSPGHDSKSPLNLSRPESQSASVPSTPGSESLPDFELLTTESAPKLDHLAKTRPKRAKTRAPTRATVRQDSLEDLNISPVDTGVSGFFDRKSVSRELVTPEPVRKENDLNSEKNGDDKSREDSSLKKKGWSPFGSKADSKSLAAGISSFFSSKKEKPGTPKSQEAPKRGSQKEYEKSPVGSRRSTPSTPELRKSPATELEPGSPAADGDRKSPARELERHSPSNELERRSPAKDLDSEETNKGDDEDDSKEEEETAKKPVGASKFGLPGMGGASGPALLAEMRAKRGTVKTSPTTKHEENKENRQSLPPSSVLNKENRSPKLSPAVPKSEARPVPVPRSGSPATLSEKPQEKGDDKAPVPRVRPPPPTKPKPPSIAPKPRAGLKPTPAVRTSSPPVSTPQSTRVSAYGSRMSESIGQEAVPTTETDSKDDDQPPPKFNPTRRRLSVKEKVAALDRNSNETPPEVINRRGSKGSAGDDSAEEVSTSTNGEAGSPTVKSENLEVVKGQANGAAPGAKDTTEKKQIFV